VLFSITSVLDRERSFVIEAENGHMMNGAFVLEVGLGPTDEVDAMCDAHVWGSENGPTLRFPASQLRLSDLSKAQSRAR
jgi:hypothetical protein